MDRRLSSCRFALLLVLVLATVSCSPEVGSTAWCEQMDEKPKGDWTMNQVADFAKHCVLR